MPCAVTCLFFCTRFGCASMTTEPLARNVLELICAIRFPACQPTTGFRFCDAASIVTAPIPPFTTEEVFPRHVIATEADPAGDEKLIDALPDSSRSAMTRPLGLRNVRRTPDVPATVMVLFELGNSQM